jgi:hypothetical protein
MLADFADVMSQDLIVAAQGGNPSPLIQYAYRGVDVAKDVWLAACQSTIETNDEDSIGEAILFHSEDASMPSTHRNPKKKRPSLATALCTAF